MKKIFLLIGLFSINLAHAEFDKKNYVTRFQNYLNWSDNLPLQTTPEFASFIAENAPLSQKVRERFLYQLARQHDWQNYSKYYQKSQDKNLQCFAAFAAYNQGKTKEAMSEAKTIWLAPTSLPPGCNNLFSILYQSAEFNDALITKRIILALENNNPGLASFLLRQYKISRKSESLVLNSIIQRPRQINQLKPGFLHDYFYLYGLKRLVPMNMNEAIKVFEEGQKKHLLTTSQSQHFLAYLTLYKAMRNNDDTIQWFNKIKPAFYNEALLDWQIRFALKRNNWSRVEYLIKQMDIHDKPCWQYWLARALSAQGKIEKANEQYSEIAKNRHYYGFLASLRLNKKFEFANEIVNTDLSILKPYQPFLNEIKTLYDRKEIGQSSRLLTDFISELPKRDKSALLYWLATHLQWHSKSVYLSNTDELTNQLSLRFPLVYQDAVKHYARNYQVPPELIYAIIRQESGFREDVVSPAGAKGLMQLMPSTASVIAKKERINYNDPKQLFSSQKNINIGVAYLSHLISRFNRHPILVAAAYNAGPTQVNYWLKNHPPKEIDIWIDTLPWHETRNYLKNIIAFYAVYQYRLQQKPDLKFVLKPLSI